MTLKLFFSRYEKILHEYHSRSDARLNETMGANNVNMTYA